MSEQSQTKSSKMIISKYSDSSIAVQGDTWTHKENLKILGGKYNNKLRGGPGWVFHISHEDKVRDFVENGKLPPPTDEEKTPIKENSTPATFQTKPPQPFSHAMPTLTEYALLLTSINNLTTKINNIETAISFLLNDEQKKTLTKMIEASNKKIPEKEPVKDVVKDVVKEKTKVPVKKVQYDSDSSGIDMDDPIPVKRLLKN